MQRENRQGERIDDKSVILQEQVGRILTCMTSFRTFLSRSHCPHETPLSTVILLLPVYSLS